MEFQKAIEVVTRYMDLRPLKPKQIEAVKSFVSGQDTFVALPTGYGKSVIFAVLPLLFDKLLGVIGTIIVVITPLVSLMIDQKEKFTKKGIATEFVGEAQESDDAVTAVLSGRIQLVYISPESLLGNPRFRSMLFSETYKMRLRGVVVDEAHCVKLWGDEFRVMFAEIGSVRSLIPVSVKVLALTATATKQTLESVKDRLSMDNPSLIGLRPDRANIKYIVEPCPDIRKLCCQLTDELMAKRTATPKTILFCRSLQHCANIFALVKQILGRNITEPPGVTGNLETRLVDIFTSVSTTAMREMLLEEYCKTDTNLRLLIATTAFGLGVDCPDIERVINWGSPNTLEELVQESGRAGRDGRQAVAILYPKKVGRKLTKEVKEYQENTIVCRRRNLFKNFLFSTKGALLKACACCDLCTKICACEMCINQ